jgi:hypothetical protein
MKLTFVFLALFQIAQGVVGFALGLLVLLVLLLLAGLVVRAAVKP